MKFLLIPLLVLSTIAYAQTASQESKVEYESCIRKAQTPSAKLQCMQKELTRLDAELEKVKEKQKTLMDPASRRQMDDYQTSWAQWRLQHCDMSLEGSFQQRTKSMECIIQLTVDRLALLNGKTSASTPDIATCLRRAGRNLSLQSLCYRDELYSKEKDLERAYRLAQNRTLSRKELSSQQQQWLSERPQKCPRPKFFEWESYKRYMACLIAETETRIKRLSQVN